MARAGRARVSLVGPNGAGKTSLIEASGGAARPRRRPPAFRAQRPARLPLSTRTTSARAEPCSTRPSAPASRRARHVRCSGASCSAARRSGSRSTGSRAASDGVCLAGHPHALGRQRPGDRRADQPSRSRRARGARGCPARLRRSRAPGLARPRPARRRGHPHGGARGRPAAQLRRRLGEYSRVREERRQAESAAGTGRARSGTWPGAPATGRATAPPRARRRPLPSRMHCAGWPSSRARVERAEAALTAVEGELADPRAVEQPDPQQTFDEAPRRGQAGR